MEADNLHFYGLVSWPSHGYTLFHYSAKTNFKKENFQQYEYIYGRKLGAKRNNFWRFAKLMQTGQGFRNTRIFAFLSLIAQDRYTYHGQQRTDHSQIEQDSPIIDKTGQSYLVQNRTVLSYCRQNRTVLSRKRTGHINHGLQRTDH